LARVGGRYTDEWHLIHLINPRDLVPESNMPGFPWLQDRMLDGDLLTTKMKVLRWLGDPYTDQQITEASSQVEGVTEMDALIAYLQYLGVANNERAQK
jgi:cytochrome c oxidase cbb3-type subunit 2